MNSIVWDENGNTRFDFSKAQNVFEPHELANMYAEYLSDVDFVVEDSEQILCIEYKNADIEGAGHPEAFEGKVKQEPFWKRIAKKYYGTLFVMWACDKNSEDKPVKYILLTGNNPEIDRIMKKKVMEKMKKHLPFKYNGREEVKRSIIDEFRILNLEEWKQEYPEYPVKINGSDIE